MGKRKSRATKPPGKKKVKLDTVFKCPFCSHDESVQCIIDRKDCIGEVVCCLCEASYGTKLTPLTEPIDIYHEWIDECELVNKVHHEDTQPTLQKNNKLQKIHEKAQRKQKDLTFIGSEALAKVGFSKVDFLM